jgi:hypothetical protein
MAKPTLLVLGSTFPVDAKDGTPSFVLDLAKEQSKSFDVTVLTPFVSGSKRIEVIDDVKVIRFRYWPFSSHPRQGCDSGQPQNKAHNLAPGSVFDARATWAG